MAIAQNNLKPIIKTTEERSFTPKLLWPCFIIHNGTVEEKDKNCFDGKIITYNCQFFEQALKRGYAVGSSEFWACFDQSQDILFADLYFNKPHYERLFRQLQKTYKAKEIKNKKIRIYCKKENSAILNTLNAKRVIDEAEIFKKFQITIKPIREESIMHDRFAIMDQEIWHCGAAVGGMHEKMSAVSRGWKDVDHALQKYFDEEVE